MWNSLLRRLTGKSGTRDTAKKRLRFALVYDQLEVSDETLSDLQRDIVDVISRYFEIDSDAVKLDISRGEDLSALVLSTPILSARKRT